MITVEQLNALDTNQLRALNAQIVKIVRNRSVKAAVKFFPGQQVSYTSARTGLVMKGTVEKVNIKKVVVNTGATGIWNVPASMLEAV